MNDFNATESKFASFLKEEAELDTITLPPLRAGQTQARKNGFLHKNTVAGLAVLAVAASAIGFVLLRDPGERTAKVSVAGQGDNTDSSVPAIKQAVIAKAGEYSLSNREGKLVILDRTGKVRANIETPGRVRRIWFPTMGTALPRVAINTPDMCSDPAKEEPYGIYELDLAKHSLTSLVDLDVKSSGQYLSFSADGNLAKYMYDANPIKDCAFFSMYLLESGSSQKIELPEPWVSGYVVDFLNDGGIQLRSSISGPASQKCAVIIPTEEVTTAGMNLEPLFTRYWESAAPIDSVKDANDREYSSECYGNAHPENILNENVQSSDTQPIPAGTNIGVLN